MTKLGLAAALWMVVFSCNHHPDNLCKEDPEFKIYDFDGLEVYGSIEDGLKCAQVRQKPIFLLFSGFGCVGDTSYEEELFVRRKNRRLIAEQYVPVILFVDDKRKLKSSDIEFRNINGKARKIETIGAKNARYEMEEFQMNTQPLLVILDHHGEQILTPITYQPDPSAYHEYLERGLQQYQQLTNPTH